MGNKMNRRGLETSLIGAGMIVDESRNEWRLFNKRLVRWRISGFVRVNGRILLAVQLMVMVMMATVLWLS